jgi:hypothetical protein
MCGLELNIPVVDHPSFTWAIPFKDVPASGSSKTSPVRLEFKANFP